MTKPSSTLRRMMKVEAAGRLMVRRDHEARSKDQMRARLAKHVAAYLARGGTITEAEPFVTAPGRPPAHASYEGR